MSLSLVLILIGFAGLIAALWAQVRAFRFGEAAYRRRQKQAALGLAGLLLALGAVQAAHSGRIVERLTAPEVDGNWAAVAIDGRAVAAQEWRLVVARGKVAGGRDACNDWGFDESRPVGGERAIVSTLVGCPEDDPVRRAYWALALADDAALQLRADGTLRVVARGHEAILSRCRWTNEPLPPAVRGTGRRICVPE